MDQQELERLIRFMDAHDLVEMAIVNENGTEVRLRKREAPVVAALPVPASVVAGSPAGAPPVSAADDGLVLIRSPMVGTFYRSPSPESPPFVEVGDEVEPDTTVCIVEAMKVFNEIKAERAGTIVRALVENADGVEYDTPLFQVRPKNGG